MYLVCIGVIYCVLIDEIKQIQGWIFSVKCKICYQYKKVFYFLNDDNNNDDDDDDDDELCLWYGWATKGIQSYFQPGSTDRDPPLCEFPTRCEQDLNLRRTRV